MALKTNTILEQTGQQVQEAINKIIDLGPATNEKAGLLEPEDKTKLTQLYVDPALVGRATAPTPPENEDSTRIATTAYVQNMKRKMLSELVVTVDELPTATEQTMGRIYLVPNNDEEAQNTMDEYITVRSGTVGHFTYSWERFGTVDVPPQEQANWNEADTDSPAYIKNKPSIPAAQVNSDWSAGSGVAQILNKPTIPSQLSQLSEDSTHRVVTDTEKSTWGAKYSKPQGGIPASDLASGVIPALSTDIDADKTSNAKAATPKAVYSELTTLRTEMAAIDALFFDPVATLPTASASTKNNHIYLVPNQSDNNYRDMYVTIESGGIYQWYQIGTTLFNITGIANLSYKSAVLEQNVVINA